MTIQVDFWHLMGLLLSFIGTLATFGMVLIKQIDSRIDHQNDRVSKIEALATTALAIATLAAGASALHSPAALVAGVTRSGAQRPVRSCTNSTNSHPTSPAPQATAATMNGAPPAPARFVV